jgi:hypothetical protein
MFKREQPLPSDIFEAKWIRLWLKGRDEKNLYAVDSVTKLVLGFADTSNGESVFFNIKECKKDPGLFDLYKKLSGKKKPDGAMTADWLLEVVYAISQNR